MTTPTFRTGDQVAGSTPGGTVAGRFLRRLAGGLAVVATPAGDVIDCTDVAPADGVGVVVPTAAAFAAWGGAVTAAVTGEDGAAARLDLLPVCTGSRRGWGRKSQVYVSVLGSPALCEVTVSVKIVGADKWPAGRRVFRRGATP